MRNIDLWKPTKVVRDGNGFAPSPDPRCVAVSSRLIVSCLVENYQRAIQKFASGRMLDLGCGFVPYYELYRNLVSEVVCVDWENSLHKNDFLDHFMDLNEPLALASESFDTVLLTDVLEHIYRPAQLLSEVARVLRPAGHVIIGVPFMYGLHEEPFDFHRYTEFSLRQMCADLGLEVQQLTPYGGVPEILLDITGKCLIEAKLHTLGRLHAATARALMKLKLLQSVSRKTAYGFPLGYVVAARKKAD
jgi:SAM-dependent methyltransferase